jgi:hypothetical protein
MWQNKERTIINVKCLQIKITLRADSHIPCRSPATLKANSNISCRSHAVPLPQPCRGLERSVSKRHSRGIAGEQHGNGMACVNKTRSHCVNEMGKTQFKPLAERHGEQHGMCESAFRQLLQCFINQLKQLHHTKCRRCMQTFCAFPLQCLM